MFQYDGGFHDAAESSHASYEAHPVESMEPLAPPDLEKLGTALAAIFRWMTQPHVRDCSGLKAGPGTGKRRVVETICPRKLGMRTAAMIYSLRPDLFPGETAMSLAGKIGVTKQAFAKHVRAFRVTFDIQTRVMRSAAARDAMRNAALDWHAKRKLVTPLQTR